MSFFDAELTPALNCLRSRNTPELSAAIEYLLCSKAGGGVSPAWVREDTYLSARLIAGGAAYAVHAAAVHGTLKLVASDEKGNDVTDEYRYILSHCPEQDAIECFDGRDRTLPFHLCRYRIRGDDGSCVGMSDRTEHLAATQTFRSQLLRYIKAFRPEPVNCRKQYQVTINRQGAFEVVNPETAGSVFLSETEEKLFLFICYLNIAQFWSDVEMLRDLHHEKKPLLVRNFIEFLDESADIDHLMERTMRLGRQVLMLTLPEVEG